MKLLQPPSRHQHYGGKKVNNFAKPSTLSPHYPLLNDTEACV
jgi:hypothetical protein